MLSSNGQIELFALYDEIADIENDNDEPIILNTPNKDGESMGVITDAIFISNNSDNKEKALEFIGMRYRKRCRVIFAERI